MLYPVTITQPHSLVTSKTIDYQTGKEELVQQPNGGIASTTYDGLGRPTSVEITDAANPSGALVTKNEYTYMDSARPSYTRTRDYLTASAPRHLRVSRRLWSTHSNEGTERNH